MWRCGALVFSCMKPPGGRAPTKCRYLFSVLHVYYLDNCNVEHLGAGHMPSLQTALAIATPGQPPWYRILKMTRQRRPSRSNCMHHDPSSTHEALRAFCTPPTGPVESRQIVLLLIIKIYGSISFLQINSFSTDILSSPQITLVLE